MRWQQKKGGKEQKEGRRGGEDRGLFTERECQPINAEKVEALEIQHLVTNVLKPGWGKHH